MISVLALNLLLAPLLYALTLLPLTMVVQLEPKHTVPIILRDPEAPDIVDFEDSTKFADAIVKGSAREVYYDDPKTHQRRKLGIAVLVEVHDGHGKRVREEGG